MIPMKKEKPIPAEQKESSYYELHTEAVEDLVTATKENTPKYSKEELEKYRSSKGKWKIPQWLKAVLIKFWFYGAVCYFVFWGLGLYLQGLDLFFVAAVILGMVTDLPINHFLRFTEKLPGGSKKWMMVTRRGTAGFFLNIAYGFLQIFLIVTLYNMINSVIAAIYSGSENVPLLHVEPLFFGLAAVGVDMLCVTIRNLFLRIVEDARKKG